MIKVYASYFVSYFLKEIGSEIDKVRNIILFGSVAKGSSGRNSDVDIFIDVKKKSKVFEKKVDKILDEYYKSREALLFKAKGIDNKINLISGKLDEWKDLKKSIESTGIVLYGPYISIGGEGGKHSIIFWDGIKKNRGAFLNKLYGFRVKDKRYKGLLEEFNGQKLGKSSIMISVEFREDIVKLLKKYGVNAKIIEVYL